MVLKNIDVVGRKPHTKEITHNKDIIVGAYRAKLISIFANGVALSNTTEDFSGIAMCELDGRYYNCIRSVNTYLKLRYGVSLVTLRHRPFRKLIAVHDDTSYEVVLKYTDSINDTYYSSVSNIFGEFMVSNKLKEEI